MRILRVGVARRRALLGTILLALAAGASTPARGAGLSLPTHGVRALGRGGAFVAGGDDPSALWFNPATLDLMGNQGLLAGTLVLASQRYQRVDSGGNPQPEVASSAPATAVPTAAASFQLPRGFTIGVALSAPLAGSSRYRPDGPQRYSLIDLDGTFMVRVEAAVAYRLLDRGPAGTRLSVGASVQDLLLNFESFTVLNACPGTVVTAPEDPQCDARTRFKLGANANFSGNFGAHLSHRWLRAAVAFQLPTWVKGTGKVSAGIPTHPLFRHEDGSVKASQVGETARLSLTLPWILRAGVEVRPSSTWRAEVEIDYEAWSMHDAIRVVPQNVKLTNLNGGVPEYDIGTVNVWRKMKDTVSVRAGGEWDFHHRFTARAGLGYETAAPPTRLLTLLTVDMPKLTFGAGLSFRPHELWRIDVGYSYVLEIATTVPLQASPTADNAICQLSPLRPEGACVQVNAGTYHAGYHLAGVGLVYSF